MKKYIPLLTLAILTLTLGCKENKAASVEPNQMKKVMAIHDEVMPKMSAIGKLVGELKAKVDTTAQGMAYEKAMSDLQEANASMMNWMQGFGDRFDSDEILNGKALSEQKQEWLNEEETKVKLVKEKINSSIANAEAILAGH